MSTKDASLGDGSSKVQDLELLSDLPGLREGDSSCVIAVGGWSCSCSTPRTLFVTEVAIASSLAASPLGHYIPKQHV